MRLRDLQLEAGTAKGFFSQPALSDSFFINGTFQNHSSVFHNISQSNTETQTLETYYLKLVPLTQRLSLARALPSTKQPQHVTVRGRSQH